MLEPRWLWIITINYGTSTGAANESRTALGGQKQPNHVNPVVRKMFFVFSLDLRRIFAELTMYVCWNFLRCSMLSLPSRLIFIGMSLDILGTSLDVPRIYHGCSIFTLDVSPHIFFKIIKSQNLSSSQCGCTPSHSAVPVHDTGACIFNCRWRRQPNELWHIHRCSERISHSTWWPEPIHMDIRTSHR